MRPELKKMLEVAGVDAHVKKETGVFKSADDQLVSLCSFLEKQEGDEYVSLCKDVKSLREKLKKHLAKYS